MSNEEYDNRFLGNAFKNIISAIVQDPQFIAQDVMHESLAGILPQMTEEQLAATEKLIAQFARALDQAGMLVLPKEG